jgi:hypothetical protein
MDAAQVSASLILQKHRILWRSLLSHLQTAQEAKVLQCLRFTWYPMSDETPTPNRVTYRNCQEKEQDVADDTQDSDADLNTVNEIAKVMATRILWSMALAMKHQGSLHDKDAMKP